MTVGVKHKHHNEIVAWAGGAAIEYYCTHNKVWKIATNPSWAINLEYRVKPEPKPDVITYAKVNDFAVAYYSSNPNYIRHNVKFVFDGDTKELKEVQLINQGETK